MAVSPGALLDSCFYDEAQVDPGSFLWLTWAAGSDQDQPVQDLEVDLHLHHLHRAAPLPDYHVRRNKHI